jgi:hypothetical protein
MQLSLAPPHSLLQTTSLHPSLPPSDFTDLILAISQHELSYDDFLASPPSSLQHKQKVAALLQQSRDLSAHYGWVLASDIVMVGRMFGGDEESAREWVKGLKGRVEGIERVLGEM